jgi:hypothetical protein
MLDHELDNVTKQQAERISRLMFHLGAISLLDGITGNFLVISFQCSEILASLGEFTFFHALTHIPVYKSTLGVHEVELMVKAAPCLGDSCSVSQHADRAVHGSELTARDTDRLLVIDP